MCTFFWRQVEQGLAFVDYFAAGNFVTVSPRENVSEGALTLSVGTHDGMYFARVYFDIQLSQYRFAVDRNAEIFNFQH